MRPSTHIQQREFSTVNKSEIIQQLQAQMIRAWLHKIGEPEEDHYLVIDKCKHDHEALTHFLKWAGIDEE